MEIWRTSKLLLACLVVDFEISTLFCPKPDKERNAVSAVHTWQDCRNLQHQIFPIHQ